jgi:hypothetical protein
MFISHKVYEKLTGASILWVNDLDIWRNIKKESMENTSQLKINLS